MNYEIPDLAVKYNDLLGLGKMSNLGIDENYFLANTGSSAEMKEKKSDNTVGTVEVQSIHEISYIQTAEDIRTKLVSSCSETENISVTGEPYDVPKNLSSCASISPASPPGTQVSLSSSRRPGWRTSSPSAGRGSIPSPSPSPWSSSRG